MLVIIRSGWSIGRLILSIERRDKPKSFNIKRYNVISII